MLQAGAATTVDGQLACFEEGPEPKPDDYVDYPEPGTDLSEWESYYSYIMPCDRPHIPRTYYPPVSEQATALPATGGREEEIASEDAACPALITAPATAKP